MAAGKPICDRKQLVQVLYELPESAVQEIMDFAEFIFAKRIKRKKVIQKKCMQKTPF